MESFIEKSLSDSECENSKKRYIRTARKMNETMTKHHSSDPRKLVLEKVIVEFITCTRSTFSKHGIGIMQA